MSSLSGSSTRGLPMIPAPGRISGSVASLGTYTSRCMVLASISVSSNVVGVGSRGWGCEVLLGAGEVWGRGRRGHARWGGGRGCGAGGVVCQRRQRHARCGAAEPQPDRPGRTARTVRGSCGAGGGDGDGRGAERGAGGGFPLGGREPEQHRGGDLGRGYQVLVAAELGGQPAGWLGRQVDLDEEVDLVLGVPPAAVPVGADQAAPAGRATPLRPPGGQGPVSPVAGGAGEGGEEPVDGDQVVQLLPVRDAKGVVAAVPHPGRVEAAAGGEHPRAGGAEDVVVGGGAQVAAGPEPLQHSEAVQDDQAVLGGVEVGEGEVGELVGGEHAVLVHQLAQPQVPRGQPGRQVREPRSHTTRSTGRMGAHAAAGARRTARGGTGAPAAAKEWNGAPVADQAGGAAGRLRCGFAASVASGSTSEADPEANPEADWTSGWSRPPGAPEWPAGTGTGGRVGGCPWRAGAVAPVAGWGGRAAGAARFTGDPTPRPSRCRRAGRLAVRMAARVGPVGGPSRRPRR